MILYIGNKLTKHGNTPTSVEILGNLLNKDFEIVLKSDKKNKLLRLVDMLFSIVKYRKKTKFLLIDTYSTSNFYFAVSGAIVAKAVKVKYIPLLRGGDLPNRIKSSPFLSKLIFSNAYINIAPSNYLFQAFNNDFRVKYIPNNIEISNYEYKKREVLKPKLLYVRAFSKVYNPQMALYVLEKLVKKYPSAELCMVGPDRDGTFEEVQKLSHTLKLSKNIVFKGKMKKKEWWELSKEYDIFINTTNFDNTPVSVMEAMALGLPVISTNVGGIPYLLDDGKDSLLVDKNDVEGMYEKINEALTSNKKALFLSNNARKKVESFDWENVKKTWYNLLNGEINVK